MVVIIRCTPGMPQVSDCHCYYCYNTQGRQTRFTVGTNMQSEEKMGSVLERWKLAHCRMMEMQPLFFSAVPVCVWPQADVYLKVFHSERRGNKVKHKECATTSVRHATPHAPRYGCNFKNLALTHNHTSVELR